MDASRRPGLNGHKSPEPGGQGTASVPWQWLLQKHCPCWASLGLACLGSCGVLWVYLKGIAKGQSIVSIIEREQNCPKTKRQCGAWFPQPSQTLRTTISNETRYPKSVILVTSDRKVEDRKYYATNSDMKGAVSFYSEAKTTL
jgi:hypothetical protein